MSVKAKPRRPRTTNTKSKTLEPSLKYRRCITHNLSMHSIVKTAVKKKSPTNQSSSLLPSSVWYFSSTAIQIPLRIMITDMPTLNQAEPTTLGTPCSFPTFALDGKVDGMALTWPCIAPSSSGIWLWTLRESMPSFNCVLSWTSVFGNTSHHSSSDRTVCLRSLPTMYLQSIRSALSGLNATSTLVRSVSASSEPGLRSPVSSCLQ
mmetsp:Transcript_19357/g.45026  ORF Transcript_19357/g.45026 Transcript_19357/m.45026 type:complete len:206 (-) Transcript_19357:482-1099(-)